MCAAAACTAGGLAGAWLAGWQQPEARGALHQSTQDDLNPADLPPAARNMSALSARPAGGGSLNPAIAFENISYGVRQLTQRHTASTAAKASLERGAGCSSSPGRALKHDLDRCPDHLTRCPCRERGVMQEFAGVSKGHSRESRAKSNRRIRLTAGQCSPSQGFAKRGGRPVTWIGGGGLDSKYLAQLGVPKLRELFFAVFGEGTASNNAAWLRRKLGERPDSVYGQGRCERVRARDAAAAIWVERDDGTLGPAEGTDGGGAAAPGGVAALVGGAAPAAAAAAALGCGLPVLEPAGAAQLNQMRSLPADGRFGDRAAAAPGAAAPGTTYGGAGGARARGRTSARRRGAARASAAWRAGRSTDTSRLGQVYWPDDDTWWAATVLGCDVAERRLQLLYSNLQEEEITGDDLESLVRGGHLAASLPLAHPGDDDGDAHAKRARASEPGPYRSPSAPEAHASGPASLPEQMQVPADPMQRSATWGAPGAAAAVYAPGLQRRSSNSGGSGSGGSGQTRLRAGGWDGQQMLGGDSSSSGAAASPLQPQQAQPGGAPWWAPPGSAPPPVLSAVAAAAAAAAAAGYMPASFLWGEAAAAAAACTVAGGYPYMGPGAPRGPPPPAAPQLPAPLPPLALAAPQGAPAPAPMAAAAPPAAAAAAAEAAEPSESDCEADAAAEAANEAAAEAAAEEAAEDDADPTWMSDPFAAPEGAAAAAGGAGACGAAGGSGPLEGGLGLGAPEAAGGGSLDEGMRSLVDDVIMEGADDGSCAPRGLSGGAGGAACCGGGGCGGDSGMDDDEDGGLSSYLAGF
ncbi:MAG: hypothetical protein J3K34DRAFT_461196 [Monoraphidium minutum]|nr:MAG: hypothetical protein J3K34DRAFT_461196 [Monoraphidium minutum]